MRIIIDYNLLGIFLSSIVIIISIFTTIYSGNNIQLKKCDQIPTLKTFYPNSSFIEYITNIFANSNNRILICSTNIESFYGEPEILLSLKEALLNGVYISFIFSKESYLTDILRQNGFFNISIYDISINYIITDDSSLFLCSPFDFNYLFNNPKTCLNFNSCQTAIEDLINLNNFIFLKSKKLLPFVNSINMQSKTSLINPLFINNSKDSLYFFHNSPKISEIGRIGIESFFDSILMNSPFNISIFLNHIPSLIDDQLFYPISFFTLFKRFLSTQTHIIQYLIPYNDNLIPHQWLDTTAAFIKAKIKLYNITTTLSNFIIIGNRTFIFSHDLLGKNILNYSSLHFSTNSSIFTYHLKKYFNNIWNKSITYSFKKKKKN